MRSKKGALATSFRRMTGDVCSFFVPHRAFVRDENERTLVLVLFTHCWLSF